MIGEKFISQRLLTVFLVTSIFFGGFFIFGAFDSHAMMVAPPNPPGPPSPPDNNDPALVEAAQYKLDGQEVLEESGITTGETVVLAVTMSDPDDDLVKFRIEVCPIDEPFTINCGLTGVIMESDFLPSGSTLKATTTPLSENMYRWRVKIYDEQGGESAWQEFGVDGNIDFTIDTVELYTQIKSQYPSEESSEIWSKENYATASSSMAYWCGYTIGDCGCAITSGVMKMRHHGITENIDNTDVNPKNINDWLNNYNVVVNKRRVSGYNNGSVNWATFNQYAKDPLTKNLRIAWKGAYNINQYYPFSKIKQMTNDDLDTSAPVIVRDGRVGHFFVLTEKLNSSYLVRDPLWYNTRDLDQKITAAEYDMPWDNYKRDYNNYYTGIRRFTLINPNYDIKIYKLAGLDLSLASPAELLLTDPMGRKLGKDPINNIEYNEIPDSIYSQESIGNPASGEPDPHPIKTIWIDEPLDGDYGVQVIGTDNGSYALSNTITDQQGEVLIHEFEGQTQTNLVTSYTINFSPEDVNSIGIEPDDTQSPVTQANISGQPGNNSWYMSNVEVVLTAQDNQGGVGVYKTEYSQDNGATWQIYTAPIVYTHDGVYGLLYRSEDFVGNLEAAKSLEIKIDQTKPEAEMFFDADSKKLIVQGKDEQLDVSKDEHCSKGLCFINYSLEDQAGHQLKLFFRQPKNQAKILTQLQKIQYNQDEPIVFGRQLHYVWTSNWFDKSIKTLVQSIGQPFNPWIRAVYNKSLGKTIITIKQDGVQQKKIPGLVIIKLFTQQGELKYEHATQ